METLKMMKTLFAATVLGFALAAPAYAADMAKCDDATMKMVMDAIKADTDPAMKAGVDKATAEMAMAGEAMKANKMDECSKHIGMAKESMMMK
jgi:hypothetical protein